MSENRRRHHLGTGDLQLPRTLCVFINCPFDNEFQPIFDAIVFSTVCCGFVPRCAVESGTAARTRIDRITNALLSSKYSIHDLTRCRGEGDMNLARFNMPLELGMALVEGSRNEDGATYHDWLALVPPGHAYKRFISDLAGFDPSEYDGTTATVVPAVMSWLATRPDAVHTPTPREVLQVLPRFTGARVSLGQDWHTHVPWTDLVMAALRAAKEASLVPS